MIQSALFAPEVQETCLAALSMHQPWASGVALGLKAVETRSWATSYRGTLIIQASRGTAPDEWFTDALVPFLTEHKLLTRELPTG